jgi:hypothetical protein
MRKSVVAVALLLSFVTSNRVSADVTVRVMGQLTYAAPGGYPPGLWDATVEIWEDDTGDDDLEGSTLTNYDGNYLWQGSFDDRGGLGNPSIYLKVVFKGSRVDVYSEWGSNTQTLMGDVSIDDLPFVNGAYQLEFSALVGNPGHTEVTRRSAFVHQAVQHSLNASSPPGIFGVYLTPTYVGETAWEGTNGPLLVSWNTWEDRPAINRGLAYGILSRLGDRSGTPAPPGGNFWTVTNEGYAWDWGAISFLADAMYQGSSGVYLESDVPVPAQIADAPRIAANVSASLWDLFDQHPDDAAGPGRDNYSLPLQSIVNLLEGAQIRSLQEFWNAWKATALPRHLPILALRHNGVDFNTPATWDLPDPIYASPGELVTYHVGDHVVDPETPLQSLILSLNIGNTSGDPVSWYFNGHTLYATMNPADGTGHAFFFANASDEIATATGVFRIIWTNGTKPGPPELDPAAHEAVLSLSGDALIRGAGAFRFTLPRDCNVNLAIFDANGRRIRTLVDELRTAGRHEVSWSPSWGGERVAPGVYFLALNAGAERRTLRTVVLQ